MNLTPDKHVSLTSRISPPNTRVKFGNNRRLAVVTDDNRYNVGPGEIRTIQFSPTSVDVRTITFDDEPVQNPHVPEKNRGRPRHEGEQTVKATPELKVRNHGEMEVVDLSDTSTS